MKDILNEELNNINISLREYEMHEENKNSEIKELKDNIIKNESLVGYRESNGPGVIIRIENSLTYDISNTKEDISVDDYDLLINLIIKIINALNISGAEVISINDQRYISNTDIYYQSNSIHINSVPVMLPLEIKAIGNSEALEHALNIKYGILWTIKEHSHLHMNLEKVSNITIPRYDKIIQYKYAKPINN